MPFVLTFFRRDCTVGYPEGYETETCATFSEGYPEGYPEGYETEKCATFSEGYPEGYETGTCATFS